MERPRVLLADDHRAILDREVSLLKPSFEIVGIVNDGRGLVSEAHRLQPDVIVLDISMPIMSGTQAIRINGEAYISDRASGSGFRP